MISIFLFKYTTELTKLQVGHMNRQGQQYIGHFNVSLQSVSTICLGRCVSRTVTALQYGADPELFPSIKVHGQSAYKHFDNGSSFPPTKERFGVVTFLGTLALHSTSNMVRRLDISSVSVQC